MSYKQEWNRVFTPPLVLIPTEVFCFAESYEIRLPCVKGVGKTAGFDRGIVSLEYYGGNALFNRIREDIRAVKDRDPAARSSIEIFFLYPGVRAIRMYRRAHWFYKHNMKFIARWISQSCARKTGIEIHPGATIGRRLVIDHGHGVVIGETAEIGDDVLIYQGVTLGGTGKDVGKRHPTIGNNVMVCSGAKVLGPFKVGDNSRIAAGAVVLEEVPPNCTVVGIPAKVVRQDGQKIAPLDQIHIPDPVWQQLNELNNKVNELTKKLDDISK